MGKELSRGRGRKKMGEKGNEREQGPQGGKEDTWAECGTASALDQEGWPDPEMGTGEKREVGEGQLTVFSPNSLDFLHVVRG